MWFTLWLYIVMLAESGRWKQKANSSLLFWGDLVAWRVFAPLRACASWGKLYRCATRANALEEPATKSVGGLSQNVAQMSPLAYSLCGILRNDKKARFRGLFEG